MKMTSDPNAARKGWLSVLATSPATDVVKLWTGLKIKPEHTVLRNPEIGGVMVRGRAGAIGAAFNLGEMTVTRASVKLSDGTVGHGYVQGRGRDHALCAALVDAVMQTESAEAVEAGLLKPLRDAMANRKTERAAKAAATKVDFFTLVRGED